MTNTGAELIPRVEEECQADNDQIRQFLATIESSYQNVDVQQDLYDAAVDKVVSTAIDPITAEALQAVAGIDRWRLFGKPGDPLPRGLVKYIKKEGELNLDYDPRLFSVAKVDALRISLYHAGVGEVLKMRSQQRRQNLGAIQQAYRAAVTSRPAYHVMKSFESEPIAETLPRPLSLAERVLREVQIEQKIRERYGLERDVPIPPRSDPAIAIQREFFKLDEETSPHKQEAEQVDDGLKRARDYIESVAQRHWDKYYAATKGPAAIRWDSRMTHFSDLSGDRRNGLSSVDVGRELYLQFNSLHTYPVDLVDQLFCISIVEELFYHSWVTSVPEAIDGAMATCGLSTDNSIYQSFTHQKERILHYEVMWPLDEAGARLLPEGPVMAEGSYMQLQHEYGGKEYFRGAATGHSVNFVDQTEYLELSQQPRGRVMARPGVLSFNTPRLVMANGHPIESVPAVDIESDHDVEAYLYFDGPGSQAPFIPGCKLTGRTEWGAFYYKVEDSDPYSACLVEISEDDRLRLAGMYQATGLDGLAQKVRQDGQLTVESLRAYIQSETDYYLPSDYAPTGTFFGQSQIGAYSTFVRNGKLQLQCTGSANFLKASLDAVFGKGHSSVVSGYAFRTRNDNLPGLEHAQTIFSHEGLVYILDATGTYTGGRAFLSQYQPTSPSENNRPAPVTSNEKVAALQWHDDDLEHLRLNLPPAVAEDGVKDVLRLLTDELCVRFGVPTDKALFEQLVKVPEHDPVRRTLKVVLHATEVGNVEDEAQLEQLADYLDKYHDADPALLRRTGLRKYDDALIQTLERAVNGLIKFGAS